MIKLILEWLLMMVALFIVVFAILALYNGNINISEWTADSRKTATALLGYGALVATAVQIYRTL